MIQYVRSREAVQVDSKAGVARSDFSKKAYLKPRLHVYGSVESITQFNAGKGSGDNRNKRNAHSGG